MSASSNKVSVTNSETLQSYEARVQEYIDGTSQILVGAAKEWIDAALADLSPEAKIVELGSAHGRDAAYIVSKGFEVECTDAVAGFISQLQAKWFNARHYNALTDDLGNEYDLILANAVLLHFNKAELALVLRKLLHSLKKGGRLAFSLKQGQGEVWSVAKIGAPRFFCYWEQAELEPFLGSAGFTRWSIEEALTGRVHAEWLFVIAFNS